MKVFIPGNLGYVGSALMPKLLKAGHNVVGMDILAAGDIRDINHVKIALAGCDAVIHLACLSNDPTSDLDPALTKSINLDSFRPMVKAAKDAGVKRFIFASSSSVYGVKNTPDVTEDMNLEPLTDYSTYKAVCEEILLQERGSGFETVIVRPATICGVAPALRLDLCVHILTMAALKFGEIKVFGGEQYRPNIHIDDICDAYLTLLGAPAEKVDGEIFNCGRQNMTILETAKMVRNVVGEHIKITVTESTDPRSYHVSSEKIGRVLGFYAKRYVSDAIQEIKDAYESGKISDSDASRYYRVRQMKELFHG